MAVSFLDASRAGPHSQTIHLHLPGLLGAPQARDMTLENVFEQT
jgi:hypothetical protein